MKAKLIHKGDSNGFNKTYEYRGYKIIYREASNWHIMKDSELVAWTSNLAHAKELVDHRINRGL